MRFQEIAFRLENSKTLDRMVTSIGVLLGIAALFGSFPLVAKVLIAALCVLLLAYAISPVFSRGFGIGWLLDQEWYCYHLTRDDSHPTAYWVAGKIKFDPSSTRAKLTALHSDIQPPRHKYTMTGYVKNGAMLFFESNGNDDIKDDCLAYFPSLRDVRSDGTKGTRISGFWLGPDQTDQSAAAPYVLSATELSEEELGQSAKAICVLSPPGAKNAA